jgi:hypothetical protein
VRRFAVISAVACAGLSAAIAGGAGLPPTATTGAGSAGLSCSADVPSHLTMTGSVNPNGQDTTWYFEYGADSDYGTQTPTQHAGSAGDDVAVSQTVTNVPPGTIHFRLVAINPSGPAYGVDHTVLVSVPPCPPPLLPGVVVTAGTPMPNASFCSTPGPTALSVVLSVTVTPVPSAGESSGSASFVYGPAAAHGLSTPSVPVPWSSSSAAPTTVSMTIAGLPLTGPTHYAVVVVGPSGETLQTGDATLPVVAVPPCVALIATKHQISVRWSLLHLSHHDRIAVIRYRLPCAASAAHTSIVAERQGVLALRVLALAPQPAAECLRRVPLTTKTIRLPHAVPRARLRHGPVTA